MTTSEGALGLLLPGTRLGGAASSPAVDFLIPGLEGLHFTAYGSSQGSVVVACARQVRLLPSKRAASTACDRPK